MSLITIAQAIELADNMDQTWRDYQVHLPPREGPNGWAIETFDIQRESIGRMQYIIEGGMDRDPGWGDGFTRLMKNRTVWMSDTRAEIMEHTPIINKLWWSERSRDVTVLVNGLGLGVVVDACLKHNVKHVDVVEIDQDVIAMCGTGRWPMDRVTVHHADAFDKVWMRGARWTFAWHDIWPTIDIANIEQMDVLHKRYKDRVNWQGSWQRKWCLKMRRDDGRLSKALADGDWAAAKRIDPLL